MSCSRARYYIATTPGVIVMEFALNVHVAEKTIPYDLGDPTTFLCSHHQATNFTLVSFSPQSPQQIHNPLIHPHTDTPFKVGYL